MGWTFENYPAEMDDLDPRVRKKAIEVANDLLLKGISEQEIITEAIKQAQEWFLNLEG